MVDVPDGPRNEPRTLQARTARKAELFEARHSVVMQGILEHHKELLDRLSTQTLNRNMGDGSLTGGPSPYRLVEAQWQSPVMKEFVRALDAHYGNPFKMEMRDGDAPPVGLWRNCYSEGWLQQLTPYDVSALHIIDEDYPFQLPDAEEEGRITTASD
ncbi:uncharacterized protein TRAVEDRAFT_54628 [Trametes versicolor FP-101664 SS1]|uniref:Uncharacterized protein n=1 Tax=Trametes versicolor (strain FP-101664) TaxID=717944 RepID=R7S710_TRAVS|nr:uncharacterized protein TRAVEDRAFT_54628 [Trametes versicolor FP-101664 SS1]EIW51367.1 hypothetical protein TRAVEDRAFT_54628 [Trametes versicolor FP-101664 SS1]